MFAFEPDTFHSLKRAKASAPQELLGLSDQ